MLRIFYPNLYLSTILEIDPEELRKRGINTLLLDLDNTIVPRDIDKFSPEIKDWLTEMRQSGFKLCVVSNNSGARVGTLAGMLDIPWVKALKPLSHSFRRAMLLSGSTPTETAVIGDQIFTDILGGNMLGIFTILVKPMAGKEFWATTIFNRQLEKLVLYRLNRYISRKNKRKEGTGRGC